MINKFNSESGFTYIELMVTIVLVAIFSFVSGPSFVDFFKSAKTKVTERRLADLKKAIVGDPELVANGRYLKPGFENDVGSIPTALSDLSTQGSYDTYDPFTKLGWRGPYVDTNNTDWSLDAWGTAFSYDTDARTITSCGPDGDCDEADDNLSISF